MLYSHSLTIEEILKKLNTNFNGLSTQEVLKRQKHFGLNEIPESSLKPVWKTFLEQFKNPIIIILLIAAIISFLIKEYTDGWFILAVLIINALIGTYLEHSAQKKTQSLKEKNIVFAKVLRDGILQVIPSREVTIGDIVLLESGDKVPADMRLIESKNLMVDESILTGESIAVLKDASVVLPKDTPVAERKNIVFGGTLVVKGRAKGVVYAIGKESEIGKIASLLSSQKKVKIPLIEKIEKLSKNIAMAVALASFIILLIAFYKGMDLKEVFFLNLALFVSAVPEGLPVAITVALGAAALAMAARKVIVRKLSAIETLGSCTLIATDKTGTLTKNQLEIEDVITKIEDIKLLAYVMGASLELKFINGKIEGDQVDKAFGTYIKKLTDLEEIFNNRTDLLPYESELKMAGGVLKYKDKILHAIKGSPEVIAGYVKEKVDLSAVEEWADKGYRIIAFAYKFEDKEKLVLDKNFRWGGFAVLIDPVREDVYNAILKAQNAGIIVVMITGDHPKTAFKIAKDLNIAVNYEEVIDSLSLEKVGEEEILQKRVFARVTPQQKLKIVRIFQKAGHYVAVTGDGVNDAPALKFAHIGVAMGSGSDVAKESAEIIITDNSFSSIVAGIEEGRRAYDNIRKVVHLLISTGFAEIILVLLSLAFATPVPLLPVHLLWLNLVTNGVQDVALGLEPAERNVLDKKPKDFTRAIFDKVMIRRMVVGGSYIGFGAFGVFYYLISNGISIDMARNSVLFLMVLFENVHVFNSRSEDISIFKINHLKNPLLITSVITAQVIHITAMHTDFMQDVLKVYPVDLSFLPLFIGLAIGLVGVMEMEKFLRKRI